MSSNEFEPTYPERAALARQKVSLRLVKSGWEKFQKGTAAAKGGKNLLVEAVKFIRAAGLDWKAARDGQLTFNAFTQNWFEGVKKCLPPECQLQKMVCAVRVAELLEGKPKQLELADCRSVMDVVLFATDVFPRQRRLQDQSATARNPYNEVVTHFTRLHTQFDRYRQTKPFTEWSPDMLVDFVRAARPLVNDVLEAEKLLAAVQVNGNC